MKDNDWDEDSGQVVERLMKIKEMTSETADILSNVIIQSLEKHGLALKKFIAISRDNPNTNKAVVKLVKAAVSKAGGKVLDYGSCVLHTGHNSCQKGIKELSIDVSNFAICLHGFFKHSTIRREKFSHELIELDLDEYHSNFVRHVESRWLTLKDALIRIDTNWEAIIAYFMVRLPSEANDGRSNDGENAKDAMRTKYYKAISSYLEKEECQFMVELQVQLLSIFSKD